MSMMNVIAAAVSSFCLRRARVTYHHITKHRQPETRKIPGGWAECAREEGVASRGKRARENVAMAETNNKRKRGESIRRREVGVRQDYIWRRRRLRRGRRGGRRRRGFSVGIGISVVPVALPSAGCHRQRVGGDGSGGGGMRYAAVC
jgi:hypothetical protein